MFLKNTELYDHLKDASFFKTEVLVQDSLDQFIRYKVGLRLKRTLVKPGAPIGMWGGLQAVQYPDELAAFLCFLRDKKITSYLEVGCSRGGTFFTIDSYLRAINSFERSLAIDPVPLILKCGFQEYAAKFKNVRYEQKKFSEVQLDQKWDLCFVDGDHAYAAAKADFEKAKGVARFVALHDIALVRSGVPKLWAEIKKQHKTVEFLTKDPMFTATVGIGIVVL